MALAFSVALASCSGGAGSPTASTTAAPPQSPPTPPPPTTMTPENEIGVVYSEANVRNGTIPLLLDVYQSGEPCTEPRPYVLLIHGGGFQNGSRRTPQLQQLGSAVAELNFVGIAIDYRLTGDQPLPSFEFEPIRDELLSRAITNPVSDAETNVANTIASAIEDGVTAVRWIEENAVDRCIDTERFAIWGNSAGANIGQVMTYGLDDFAIFESEPDVFIDYWGGVPFDGQVFLNDPPMLILHGDQDPIVDYSEALGLEAEAQAFSVPYAFYTVEGAGHSFDELRINVT
ncbi:MAG: alpha/beta hydrolase, partial [Pseudomonadota bacterium]